MDSDDDEMAELFSFGADTASPEDTSVVPTPNTTNTTTTATTTNASNTSEIDALMNDDSDDSFLKLLDEHPTPTKMGEGDTATTASTSNSASTSGDVEALMNDAETADILSWLEEDDTDADAILAAAAKESEQKAQKQQQQQQQQQLELERAKETPEPASPTLVPPPTPTFESLEAVLSSSESTKLQILEYWEQQENSSLKDPKLRPLLWCRVICNKSVDDLRSSSLADSFRSFSAENTAAHNNPALESWIRTESAKLAPRVVRANPNGMSVNEAEEALQSILLYHYHSNTPKNNHNPNHIAENQDDPADESHDNNKNNKNEHHHAAAQDPLLPPVVCAILSAGVPKLATPVLMSHIVPSFMPFVALTPEERWEAAKHLHSQFYLLACYHLPMLVYHLDRYVPGWYWPQRIHPVSNSSSEEKENNNNCDAPTHRGRHLKDQGIIPPSWLMTHLVGECGGTFMDPNRLLQLLDLVFTNENNSLRFFLVIAILEQHSDTWLELTGDELTESLLKTMQDTTALTMEEWAARARSMKQATPDSVVDRLRTAEDEAVRVALKERQKRAEEALKVRLEAEAAAHREAQERKAEEARLRLTRARLVAYYRRFNPSKEANIDKIMETFADRFEELDMKLKKKYGVGFNPALNPNKKKPTMTEAANESMKKTMQSMNEGLKRMASSTSPKKIERPENPLLNDLDTDEKRKKEHRVSVSVKVGETLPFVCMTREQANDIRRTCLQKDLPMPLRFYLVDSRAEDVAEKQGRFPTAARLSPETLMDPELLQKYEDSFEAVRGTFHICVMGEGYSAIPALYNQKLTPALEEYMREDESRTNNCALFFVKRGFPFVSVLEGGFASAHAWLVREGPKKGFDAKALLVDYDQDVSLFAQMEKIKKEQVGYKAQRALHSLMEASIPNSVHNRITLSECSTANGAKDSNEAAKKATDDGTTAANRGLGAFFGRRQVAADSEQSASNPVAHDNDTEDEKKAEAQPTEPQNRFAKWRQAAASAAASAITHVGDEIAHVTPQTEAKQETPTPDPGSAQASALAAAPVASQVSAPTPAVGRFGGFGMLRKNSNDGSIEAGTNNKPQPVLRRNPFARFGGGATAPIPPSDAAKAAVSTATSAFGGFVGAARGFRRGASNDSGPGNPAQPQPTPTIVSLPPRPDEVPSDGSANNDQVPKAVPNLRAV